MSKLHFSHRWIHQLIAEPNSKNMGSDANANPTARPIMTTSRQVKNAHFSFCLTEASPKPKLLLFSDDLAKELGITQLEAYKNNKALSYWSAQEMPEGAITYSTRYGGHQFGHWAGQLGDGRAIYLGEIKTSDDIFFELQYKGAGPSPYSRRGDGKAVLRSSLREFLCSEAMHHLGIPTTRALSLVETGEDIVRDMFYDGNPQNEKGAIVCRVANSFLRFGHFEILAAEAEITELKMLIDFCIKNYFKNIDSKSESACFEFFQQVCIKTALLIVDWMRVGFIHAVMNTDNMSILGLSIDYGPFAFLDIYDGEWTPNTSDASHRRYRYSQQANIALWNLQALAQALSAAYPNTKAYQEGLEAFVETYNQAYLKMRMAKLGLKMPSEKSFDSTENKIAALLIQKLESFLNSREIDFSIFYRNIKKLAYEIENSKEDDYQQYYEYLCKNAFYQTDETLSLEMLSKSKQAFADFCNSYSQYISSQKIKHQEIELLSEQTNPYFVLRNYLIQEALDEYQNTGSNNKMQDLYKALQSPYQENEFNKNFVKKMPDWARQKAGCSSLSCSS